MITTREELYEDVQVIFSFGMKFIELNKDGAMFADDNGDVYQIKVTKKKVKVDSSEIKDAPKIKLASKKDWREILEMSADEADAYNALKKRISKEGRLK